MPNIRFVLPNCTGVITAAAVAGDNVMTIAKRNNVSGIVGECGGSMACGTCHVYVHTDWVERVQPPSSYERELLEFVAAKRKPQSRLACQIKLSSHLDGLTVSVPEIQ